MASQNIATLQNTDDVFDPWTTKAQIRHAYCVTDLEIKALIKLGYLNPIRLGPRMWRFWSADGPPPLLRGAMLEPKELLFAWRGLTADWKAPEGWRTPKR